MSKKYWNFAKPDSLGTKREPLVGKFYDNTDIASFAEYFIRENVQNTLDSNKDYQKKENSEEPAMIRIYFGEAKSEKVRKFFGSNIFSHFKAKDCKLSNVPEENDTCHFVLTEDFYTTGLTGDIYQMNKPKDGESNNWFFYNHAEGVSGKTGQENGELGVGKVVNNYLSSVKAAFAYTIRHDDKKKYLYGHTLLKHHEVDGKHYVPDGVFGQQIKIEGEDKNLPFFGQQENLNNSTEVDDSKLIEEFKDVFGLVRDDEPGLSTLAAYTPDDIDFLAYKTALITEYFFSIIMNRIIAEIKTKNDEWALHDKNIKDHFKAELPDNKKLNKKLVDTQPLADLVFWYRDNQEKDHYKLKHHDRNRAPTWEPSLIKPEDKEVIKNRFNRGEVILIRAPMTIKYNEDSSFFQDPKETYFDILLKKNEKYSKRPFFIRGDLPIKKIQAKIPRGCCSMVIVSDDVLSECLGHAEDPAHTNWSENTDNYKKQSYKFPRYYLSFVKNSVECLTNYLFESDGDKDFYSNAELFGFLEPDPEGNEFIKVKKGIIIDQDPPPPPPPTPPTEPKIYKLHKQTNGSGFIISGEKDYSEELKKSITALEKFYEVNKEYYPDETENEMKIKNRRQKYDDYVKHGFKPCRMRVTVAYDIDGNVKKALRGYHPEYDDFNFSDNKSNQIEFEEKNIEDTVYSENIIEFKIIDVDFKLHAKNFTTNCADLAVDAKIIS